MGGKGRRKGGFFNRQCSLQSRLYGGAFFLFSKVDVNGRAPTPSRLLPLPLLDDFHCDQHRLARVQVQSHSVEAGLEHGEQGESLGRVGICKVCF